MHDETVQAYPLEKRRSILRALSEAWGWLEREGILSHRPGDHHGWKFITRVGERIRTEEDLQTFLKAKLLPKDLLHPSIADNVWLLFIRGQYDTAVFQAFKEVEVAVRTAGPEDAVEMIMLASHLLKIVDSRRPSLPNL